MASRPLEKTCLYGHGTYGADSPADACPACEDGMPPVYREGSLVLWCDPDNAACSGKGTVAKVHIDPTDEYQEIGDDTMITVALHNGGEVQAPASELTLLKL